MTLIECASYEAESAHHENYWVSLASTMIVDITTKMRPVIDKPYELEPLFVLKLTDACGGVHYSSRAWKTHEQAVNEGVKAL